MLKWMLNLSSEISKLIIMWLTSSVSKVSQYQEIVKLKEWKCVWLDLNLIDLT